MAIIFVLNNGDLVVIRKAFWNPLDSSGLFFKKKGRGLLSQVVV